MTPENFCYWLQGYMELTAPGMINSDQRKVIEEHLKLVFKKETPTYKRDPNIAPAKYPFVYEEIFKPEKDENNLPGYGPAFC